MAEKGAVWDREIEIPERWIQFVDDNVLASKLPKLAIDAYNKSTRELT
jgi:hypothetical protein